MPKAKFSLNGKLVEVPYEPGMHLLEVLREECGIVSPKNGCAPEGTCGCCAILVDGRPVLSCLRKPEQMEGRDVVTLEGVPEEMRDVLGKAFVLEGGVVVEKARTRVEDLFQLEGMNGMGLAGVELHGVIGANVLAQFKITYDFTADKLQFVPLKDFCPPDPKGAGKGGAGGGLDMMGTMMKSLGGLMGRKSTPEIGLRGFYGMSLDDGDESPKVTAVLAKGPAGVAGLKVGDVVTKIDGRSVTNVADVLKRVGRLAPGGSVKLTVQRGGETSEITITTGEGI